MPSPAPTTATEDEVDNRRPHPPPPATRLMDLDDFCGNAAAANEDGRSQGQADLASPPWLSFDPLAFLSSPSPPLLPLPPSSPLWLFEDRQPDAFFPIVSVAVDLPRFVIGHHEMTDDGGGRVLRPAIEDATSDSSCLIKERMTKALRHFKESTDQQLLVQVWAPVKKGNRWVLTTSGQPFVLPTRSMGLLQYRTVSSTFVFSVDSDDDSELGLPGRVFRQKVPEWTPNVQYYSSREYPRLCHALNYDVRGTLALPVFEASACSCIAVVELIMTSQKMNYAMEVDKVCKALEAVDLKSSEILDHPDVQICNEGRQAALAEILQILTIVCEEHNLPLAQTWVPCMLRSVLVHGGGSKKNCSSFDGSCMGQVCMSTTDVVYHVIDGHMWGFREACAEHHLQKGQGVAGRSFASRKPFFSKDITQFCKTEYPLVHYARLFGLLGCFAVCLQSSFTGSDDYILEFFLPPDCKDVAEQFGVLKSMITSMVKCLRSLKIITDLEIEEPCDVIDLYITKNDDVEPKAISVWISESRFSASRESKISASLNDLLNNKSIVPDLLDTNVLKDDEGENDEKLDIDLNYSGSHNSSFVNKSKRPSERKRGKAEKTISLEVLKQYFTGSLKDAAKSLGVCPTTMKRICRQHGISRWPSRKINKVNRSLSKLKDVIESVQGTDATFDLTSFTGTLPPGVGPIAWPTNLDELEQNKGEEPSNPITGIPGYTSNHILPNLINQSSFKREQPPKSPHSSRSGSSSGQGSTNDPTSHGSSLGSPNNEVQLENQLVYLTKDAGNPNILMLSMADALLLDPQAQNVQMLIEDSGSSQDLRNLCAPVMEGDHDENYQLPAANTAQPVHMEQSRAITIKASYKDDIIRFRLPYSAGITVLKNEVSHRLKLEVGTFDIKYLDDDHEWVMLVSNGDLEECIEVMRRAGVQLIRLSITDTFICLGTSCESSGGQ